MFFSLQFLFTTDICKFTLNPKIALTCFIRLFLVHFQFNVIFFCNVYLFLIYSLFNVLFSLRFIPLPIFRYRSHCYRQNWVNYGTCSIFNLVVPIFPVKDDTREEIAYYFSAYKIMHIFTYFLPVTSPFKYYSRIHRVYRLKCIWALSLLKFQRPADIYRGSLHLKTKTRFSKKAASARSR